MQIRTRQRGNCSMLKTVFPKNNVSRETTGNSLQLFHRNSCKIFVCCSGFTRRGGLVRPASKSGRFSHHPLRVPKVWHGDFAACGQRSGLLALNLANIFEKLLDQKTFYFVCDSHSAANSTQNKTSRPLFQTRICWFFYIKMQLKFSYGV